MPLRVDNFIVAYNPPYALAPYRPSFGEVPVTLGFISLLILLYRAAVMIFPVISLPDKAALPPAKYAVRG